VRIDPPVASVAIDSVNAKPFSNIMRCISRWAAAPPAVSLNACKIITALVVG
jgi:hypothetical protein